MLYDQLLHAEKAEKAKSFWNLYVKNLSVNMLVELTSVICQKRKKKVVKCCNVTDALSHKNLEYFKSQISCAITQRVSSNEVNLFSNITKEMRNSFF